MHMVHMIQYMECMCIVSFIGQCIKHVNIYKCIYSVSIS